MCYVFRSEGFLEVLDAIAGLLVLHLVQGIVDGRLVARALVLQVDLDPDDRARLAVGHLKLQVRVHRQRAVDVPCRAAVCASAALPRPSLYVCVCVACAAPRRFVPCRLFTAAE